MKKVLTLILSMILVGCAGPAYIEPTDGPTSTLILPSPKSTYKLLGGVSSSKVYFAVMDDEGCGGFFKPAEPKNLEDPSVELTIPGNNGVLLNYALAIGNSYCTVAGSFYAKENVSYTVEPTLWGKTCSLRVIGSEPGKKDTKEKVERAYIDSWTGKRICSTKDAL